MEFIDVVYHDGILSAWVGAGDVGEEFEVHINQVKLAELIGLSVDEHTQRIDYETDRSEDYIHTTYIDGVISDQFYFEPEDLQQAIKMLWELKNLN